MTSRTLLLAAFWAAWCTLHSAMIAEAVTSRARRLLGEAYKYYRLGYNIIALATFGLVLIYYRSLDPQMLHLWPMPWTALQGAGILAGLSFLYMGARVYNNAYFLGIEQIREGMQHGRQASSIKSSGILGAVRHPYYTGGIVILLFIGDGSEAVSVTQIILIAYLIIGTFLEERKLIHELGDSYRDYMKRVPRFLPRLFPRK